MLFIAFCFCGCKGTTILQTLQYSKIGKSQVIPKSRYALFLIFNKKKFAESQKMITFAVVNNNATQNNGR